MKKYCISYWKYKNDQWQDFERVVDAPSFDEAFFRFREANPSARIDEIKLLT